MSEVVDASLRSAVKGTALVFAGTMLSTFIWFIAKVLTVRNTTQEEFGIYSLTVAVSGFVSVIAGAGLHDGVARYVSLYWGQGRKEDARSVAVASLQMSFLLGAGATILLFGLSSFIARTGFYLPELAIPLRVVSAFVFFNAVSRAAEGILRGYSILRPRVYYVNIGQPLFFMGFLALFIAAGLPFISILWAYLLGMAASCAGMIVHASKMVGLNPFPPVRKGLRLELLRFSLPLLGVAIMDMIFFWTDTFMLGRYAGTAPVGVYNVSMTLARLLTFAMTAQGFVYMPIAGELYVRQQAAELKRTHQVLTKWVFSATLPVFFILFSFPETTISLLFGERFVESSDSLRILSAGFMINVFFGASPILLVVLGLTREFMHVTMFSTALNVVLNYLFIKGLGWGVEGASLATSLSYFVASAGGAFILYRSSGIHPVSAGYLRPAASSAVMGILLYLLAKSLPFHAWMLPIYGALFVVGYLAVLLVTRSVDREDIAMLEAVSAKSGLEMRALKSMLRRFAMNRPAER